MITYDKIILIIVLLWISIYTMSYGVWTYKRKNKLGGIMIFFIALVTILLPTLTIYFTK